MGFVIITDHDVDVLDAVESITDCLTDEDMANLLPHEAALVIMRLFAACDWRLVATAEAPVVAPSETE